MAASADAGRIAVLRSSAAWPYEWSQTGPVSIGIYSSSGKLLSELKPSSAKEIALTGDRLVVLTEAKTLQVYAWKTGTLTKTWKVVTGTPRLQAGHLAAYGTLATYSVDPRSSDARSVHVLSLTTGKDVVVGTGRSGSLGYYGRDATLGPRGLVYPSPFTSTTSWARPSTESSSSCPQRSCSPRSRVESRRWPPQPRSRGDRRHIRSSPRRSRWSPSRRARRRWRGRTALGESGCSA